MLLRLPTWAAVALIAGVSVGVTVCAVLGVHLVGPGYGPGLRRALIMGSVLPLLVSAPCAWVVIGLLRALEREHARALSLARSDALTGLANRRTLLELARRDVELARRSGHPLAVALLDLDDFKMVNDRHGHAVGDALLCAVADACVGAVRASDAVARWGGEEFVVVMPDTGAQAAEATMERVRAAVAGARVATPEGGTAGCTASIGIASLAPGDAGLAAAAAFERLVVAADGAMYAAKRAGKDRVAVARRDPPPDGQPPDQSTAPDQAVASTTSPNAMRYQANGTKS
jgi:diguanylate cyclase (GGDEF)-like protein